MKQSWNQGFATDYQERGNYPPTQSYPSYPNPNVFPSSPTSQVPSYNRSPAPFHPVQGQGQTYQEPVMNGYPASPQYEVPQYHQQSQTPTALSFSQQVVDRREQPEIDEDFPSYKDLRNVFLQKQQQAEAEERKSTTLPRRSFGQMSRHSVQSAVGKKPPPTPPRKPAINMVSSGQQDRNPVASTSYQQQLHTPQTQTSKSSVQITSHARQNRCNQPDMPTSYQPLATTYQPSAVTYQPPANTYTEIPVQRITRTERKTQVYESGQPAGRAEMGYRPPMSINVSSPHMGPSYDNPSPRVRITSNSPMSPQRAWYRPDSETDGLIIPRRTGRRHSVSFAPMVMSGSANQPRRRTSYAEIIMTSPQSPMPRSLTASSPGLVQRSFSQVTTNRVVDSYRPDAEQDEPFPDFKELKSQFSRQESNDLSRGCKIEPFGVNYSSRQRQQGDEGFTRVHMRPPQGSAQPTQPDMSQRQMPGWSATVQTGNAYNPPTIRASPHVQYAPNAGQSGKTAAHLQYNSPMGLYSTSKAQEALDRDPEAAELLKITDSQGGHTLINSPTLRAVLKEDNIKRQTGHKADVGYYHNHREYGPGIGPLRQYEEVPDTLRQTITAYNQSRDRSLTYPMWSSIN